MINVYYSSALKVTKVYSHLQGLRSTEAKVNFLGCPAVRDFFSNTYSFNLTEDFYVSYKKGFASASNNKEIYYKRAPQLIETNIFNLCFSTIMFAEKSLKVQVSSPYFEKSSYMRQGTFVGGIYDIGKWFRSIEAEIITFKEKGKITFTKNEPLFYVKFSTEDSINLMRFSSTPTLLSLSNNLTISPFSDKPQGSLESRYEAFERSNYREAILEEIKANLVSEDEASPGV
jgi:hypothetical protein